MERDYKDYVGLMARIERNKDWPLLSFFIGLSREERVEALKGVFLNAAQAHDDKSASRYFNLLLSAIDDVEFVPILKEEKGRKSIPYSAPGLEEKLEKIKKDQASVAIEVYNILPRARDLHGIILEETKKALLSVITKSWREIKNEEDSDSLFHNLLEIYSYIPEEERKTFEGVIREGTNHSFPYLRLIRHFLNIVPQGDSDYDLRYRSIAKILSIALVRKDDIAVTASIFRSCQSILQYYDEWATGVPFSAFDLLKRMADKIYLLDSDAREIGYSMSLGDFLCTPKSLREKYGQLEKEGYERIYSKINITYLNTDSVDVEVIRKDSVGEDENKYHDFFDKIKKHVLRWKKEHPQYNVCLKFIVQNQWEKEFFSRDQKF